MSETDPKTVQDLTVVVQNLLQQMQDKFQTMSDQIIGRNILLLYRSFSLTKLLDDMSTRIDDLEKNIADLMTQAGVEEEESANKVSAAKIACTAGFPDFIPAHWTTVSFPPNIDGCRAFL
ncbi:hypothetical protein XELAEV_18022656mg [Xenopus laevis]|uniref:Heat shock factor-binding protein 1 n=1 Tax=Xenopus laevis TaxID=8355 RepID=A0A974D2M7_XENLA|nr:hypothetical protein XELAEV_18022656mg [Xenopus laevis]